MIANTIAAASLLVSLCVAMLHVSARKSEKYQLEHTYSSALIDWHEDVICLLSKMRHNCIYDREEASTESLARLSALIDQGRFYFPNIDRGDRLGEGKPSAYRGYRNLALDFLIALYLTYKRGPSHQEMVNLEILQRHFTSVVFEIVRPQQRLEQIGQITDRFFMQKKSFEDFLEHPDSAAMSAIWRS